MDYLPHWLRLSGRQPISTVNGEVSKPPEIRMEVDGDEDDADEEGTPKAKPSNPALEVPTLSLNEDTGSETSPTTQAGTNPVRSSFPAANSPQRASPTPTSTLLNLKSRPKPNGVANLMPPPPRPNPSLSPRASTASSLRMPTTGPLPNRGPPAHSQQRLTTTSTLTPQPLTNPTNTKKSKKVLLSPGHSPMDWAALTSSPHSTPTLTGLPPGTPLLRIPPSHLKTMTGRKGKPAWSSWQGRVYNLTAYLPFHPGGEAEILRAAGRDGGVLFMEVHPWVNWENMLGGCLVGVLVSEGSEREEGLDELD